MLARSRSFFNPDNPTLLPRRLLWTAFLFRVAYIVLAHTFRIRPAGDHFQFAWEAGRIARALVTGNGYADVFANTTFPHTGPTAWLPPLYPLLIAAIFRIFGIYSHTSAFVLFTLQAAFSAATALTTYEIAARCFNRRVALWSAWIWALHPAAMQYAVRWPWEMSLTTALFSFTLVLALRMRGVGEPHTEPGAPSFASSAKGGLSRGGATALPAQWLIFGALWGFIALSNSTLLTFLPVCGLWILRKNSRAPLKPGAPSKLRLGGFLQLMAGPVSSALVFVALIAPWTIRNQQTFHTFIPFRGNLGAELYMGNGPSSNGLLMEYFHPFQAPDQLRLYVTMGEARYVAMRGAAAKQFIAAHPAHYAADIARRIYFFWISVPQADVAAATEAGRVLNFAFTSIAGLLGLALALRNRIPAAGLFAWAILLLPIPYYLITVAARFRHPLEPLLLIFAVYLFQSAQRRRT